ncbi:tetratricopeptide repeat protein [Luminiphilus syltensis]|nr:hypothetical protein [Luminiphilus syltensis]
MSLPRRHTRWHAALLLAAMASLFVFPVSSQAVDAGSDSAFDCAAVNEENPDTSEQLANQLLQQTWDIDRLRCGAELLIGVADERAEDPAAQLNALNANAHYAYYLDRIILYDLGHLIVWYVDDVPSEQLVSEPMQALQRSRVQQRQLLERARTTHPNRVELDYYDALLIGAQAPALTLLKPVVSEDPQRLRGAAHALLARTYYDLPDILGGGLAKAIDAMQAALERDPLDARYLRLLAGYRLDDGDRQTARELLLQLANLDVETAGLQLKADQLRAGADLAMRMGDNALQTRLANTRARLLEDHPKLLSRKVVSAMGHFGTNDPRADGE